MLDKGHLTGTLAVACHSILGRDFLKIGDRLGEGQEPRPFFQVNLPGRGLHLLLKRRFRSLSWSPRATAAALISIAALSALPALGGEGDGRLSLRVGGGAGFLGWGDVESLKDSYKNQILYAASRLGIETAGSCVNPRVGRQMEVELRYDWNRRFSLGFTCAQNHRSGEAVLTADWPPFLTSRHVWNQDTSLFTAALNAYWNLPLNRRSAVYVAAGAGLGSAVWNYKIRDEEKIDITVWEQIEGTARDLGFLLQAGIGYEFRLTRRWILFAEVRGQFISLNDWKADHAETTDAQPARAVGDTSDAFGEKLWLAEIAASGGRPAQVILLASTFSPGAGLYNGVRAFRVNFSGVVLQAGVRLELGPRPGSSNTR